jgi:hypothetical protein
MMRPDLNTLAFAVHEQSPPALEVRVNFGIFAGREATAAEIDDLAEQLLEKVSSVSIVSEERHEIGPAHEASVHQVLVEVAEDEVPPGRGVRESLAELLLDTAERWARECIDARHAEIAEL